MPIARTAIALVVVARLHAQPPGNAAAATPYTVTMQRVGDEVVLEVGPVHLPASSAHVLRGTPATRIAIPVEGWLRGYRTEVVDEAGVQVPDRHVTVNVLSLAERELFSPIALRVAAIAPGSPAVVLPRFLGYRARRGDTLLVTAEFRGGDRRDWQGVRARFRFPFVSGSAFIGALRIQPFSLEIMPPGGPHEYDLPVGRSEQYWEASPGAGGRVLGFGGYVKPYAAMLRFEDRTSKRVLWEWRNDATGSSASRSIPVKHFLLSGGLELNPAHTYRLTAVYDNRSGAPIPGGGVGTIGGVFLVGRGQRWPRSDLTDMTYLLDLERISR